MSKVVSFESYRTNTHTQPTKCTTNDYNKAVCKNYWYRGNICWSHLKMEQ